MNWIIFTVYCMAHKCIALANTCGPKQECRCVTTIENITEIDCTDSRLSLSEVCEYVGKENISRVTIMKNNFEVLIEEYFIGCENVTALNLRNGSLSGIKMNAFKEMRMLQEMDLSFNNLRCLYTRNGSCQLDHLEGLQLLYINGNVKTDVDNSSYPDLASLTAITTLHSDSGANWKFGKQFLSFEHLQNVSLSGFDGFCNIGTVRNDTFEGLKFVKNLTISHCNMTGFEAGALVHLRHLERLDFSYNQRIGFSVLPNVSFGLQFTNITTVNASTLFPTFGIGTTLEKRHICYIWNTTLKNVDLSSNRIKLFETNMIILMPETLRTARLNDNTFTFGPYMLQFACAPNVTEIYANKEFATHSPLAYNSEPILAPDVHGTDGIDCPFMKDDFLKNISLSRRHCKFIDHHNVSLKDFAIPQTVIKAEYSYCRLETKIPFLPFKNYIEYADFSGNLFDAWIGPIGPFVSLEYLDLSDNFCSKVSDNFFDEMPKLKHLQVHQNFLGLSTFTANTFGKLLELKTMNLSSNRISSLSRSVFTQLFNLETLDLSKNVIQKVDFEFKTLRNLIAFNISYNAIRRLPKRLLRHLSRVSLRRSIPFEIDLTGNVLTFSCKDAAFLNLLLEYKNNCINFDNYVFEDDDGRQVKGKVFEQAITVLNKSCFQFTYIIAGCSVGIAIFFTIVIGGLVYKHRWKLRFLMHMAKRRYFGYEPVLYQEDDSHLDEGRLIYDAFISYAEEDVKFIRTGIIPQLEETGFKLCVHQRDFLAGKPVADNIVDAIKASKKTIAILSENYVRKRWCLYEFQMARMENIYYRNNSLLIVMLEAVSAEHMPLEMIEWIDTDSYLEYTTDVDGNALFWDNLRAAVRD